VTILPLVPPVVLGLVKHPAVAQFDLSSVRLVFSGAAPLGEEIIFRGYFFRVLSVVKGPVWSAVIIALSFGLLHVEQYWGDWLAIAMVAALGLALSYLRAWTGTSLSTMVTHFFL